MGKMLRWENKKAVYMERERSYKVDQLYVGFTCRNFAPCVVPKYRRFEKEIKMAGEHTLWALLLSLMALRTIFLSW